MLQGFLPTDRIVILYKPSIIHIKVHMIYGETREIITGIMKKAKNKKGGSMLQGFLPTVVKAWGVYKIRRYQRPFYEGKSTWYCPLLKGLRCV
jgi:hypothetical protein